MQQRLLNMLEFKPLTIADRQWVEELVMKENSPNADYNFSNMYIWNTNYRQLIARVGDRMISQLRYGGGPAFVYPVGAGELRPAIEALKEYARLNCFPLVLRGLTEKQMEELRSEYPCCFEYEEDVNYADYIYLAEKLATYSGKKLHAKRNHCNRFEAEHQWEFVPLTRELIPACLDMLDEWNEENADRLENSIVHERNALTRAFAAFEGLGLEGGVLFSEGRVLGFTVGQMTSPDTFVVHFEKAFSGIQGAYPMVCRELSKMALANHPGLVYINREDDMGIEALRQSKLSYRPEFRLRKFTARWTNECM